MEWQGRTLDLMDDVVSAVVACTTKEEAAEFMIAFKAQSKFALYDLAYWVGYLGNETQDRVRGLFDLEHPFYCGKRQPWANELMIRAVITAMRIESPEEHRLIALEKMLVRFIVDQAAERDNRILLLQQLLHACYSVTRRMGEVKGQADWYQDYTNMVLFVRNLLKDDGLMYDPPLTEIA